MSYKSNLNPDVLGNSVYYSLSQNLYLAFLCLSSTMKRKDGYTTEDIVFEWIADKTEIDVGNKEMAQFDYKGSELTSGTDVFDTGQSRTMQGSIFFLTTRRSNVEHAQIDLCSLSFWIYPHWSLISLFIIHDPNFLHHLQEISQL